MITAINMNQPKSKIKKLIRETAIIILSVLAIVAVFRLVQAGSLTPSASPASTFNTLSDIFNSLASGSYDSSAITANANGSSLQIMKCALQKIRTGSCP
ncbi:MAG: hypothetical protein A2750_00465 [Candidatus Yanofskybacteria bacterium RIFCSPHIGHO2_01_FULL_45_42]|uniref:Uncharacterized protein n=3 Tax=Candidatus Yanofskyibacteriota TaxID=1752733 RepID=A0A1F8H439_9BACT|nr:MAG: hypothetical protein A2750_00465 [Candidatus Yanofskybacteria bacterium RIFCSPHIGHO2_01_FULL_45_42]OGN16401.1 MAG: hypothetical protein A3C81_03015 [Candidatus Yanofskybacteria bacterium RIFCSPHIGHO2_02_FULL_46_19]OGN27074.1 MAG: hypothetical protein A3B17_02505 [Candidatus Yanofskybacteria bacterium RIFCSPLOWO2_01_FULL_45_72]OGN32347.1 MAG: hypothetical protein A3J01_00260 [Candidatus Yanofskybacteria bacterium RIFCSPLOWO2_02_FULL_45_18]